MLPVITRNVLKKGVMQWNIFPVTSTTISRKSSATNSRKAFIHSQKPTHLDAETHPRTAEILAHQSEYLLNTYARPPIIFTHGKGCHIYDLGNRKYLDFAAGIAVNALGHGDQELADVISEQAKRLIHLSNLYHNEHVGLLAEMLVNATRANGGFDAAKVFFANSGTEANEGALKFARKWGKLVAKGDNKEEKYHIVSFLNGFHGRSMGALSATPAPKYQAPFAPLIPGVSHAPLNDVAKIPEFVTDRTCAAIIEPIQGEGGIFEAEVSFLEALKKRCEEVGALLIFDEIQCGLGRTGKLWAHQHLPKSCHPDILTTAKPLANGIPIGGIITTKKVAEIIAIGDHGTTFGGNPLASRAAISVLSRINKPEFLEHVNQVGSFLLTSLQDLAVKYPSLITEIRGRGMILGIQFSRDPTPLVRFARERGLLVITAGNDTVRIIPPLILTKEEAAEGINLLSQALADFEKDTK